MQSCIFEGRVRHSRQRPVAHRFRYRLFMMYLDLDELPQLFSRYWLWSTKRPALARFRRADHHGDATKPLAACLRELVYERTGHRPEGPIRLLTNLEYFGYCFNPVSFYFCYRKDGEQLDTIVAEVNNTPWGEQHCYVLPVSQLAGAGKPLRFNPTKVMHVSPFMDMQVDYDWCFSAPGNRLRVFMANDVDGERVFDAGMLLKRREITSMSLARVLIRYPFMTLRIMTAIHWQAFRLWLKRCPVYPHPDKRIRTVSTE